MYIAMCASNITVAIPLNAVNMYVCGMIQSELEANRAELQMPWLWETATCVCTVCGLCAQVWVLTAGELTQDCIVDMRELYGLPPKDCDSAEMLLDLYEEVVTSIIV